MTESVNIDIPEDLQDNLTPLDEIHPYADNPKEHPGKQLDKLATRIREEGWNVPIVVDATHEPGEIVKGHARYYTARDRLGLSEVPVVWQDYETEAHKRAARIADNRVAESEWDDDLLAVELDLIDESDIPPETTGFDEDELIEYSEALVPDDADDDSRKYTDKIETPVYEPTQDDAPALGECYDTDRYEELLAEIESADVSNGMREFLQLAAQRHVIFDYENIAEFYAHADPETQELMEALTLVIVDFNQAVEQGFINFADNVLDGVGDA